MLKIYNFALSFYNLIPCCSICNHIKRDNNKKLLNPYFDGFGDKLSFHINHRDFVLWNKEIVVDFTFSKECDSEFIEKSTNNISEFALKELYGQHKDYIEEIIRKAYSYNESFYDGLIHDFSKLDMTPAEIKRLIFGNYIDLTDNEKRPLSKITRDLVKDIILKD